MGQVWGGLIEMERKALLRRRRNELTDIKQAIPNRPLQLTASPTRRFGGVDKVTYERWGALPHQRPGLRRSLLSTGEHRRTGPAGLLRLREKAQGWLDTELALIRAGRWSPPDTRHFSAPGTALKHIA